MATDLSNDIAAAGLDDEDDADIDDWGDDGDITAIQLLVCGYSRAKQKENNLPMDLMNSSINQIIAAFYPPLYFVATKRHPFTGKCSESAIPTSSTNKKDLNNDEVIQLLICGYTRAKQKEYRLPVNSIITDCSRINEIIASFYEKSVIPASNYKNQQLQIDDSKEEEKRTELPTNKVNVVIGFEQETFSKKMLSSKLDYFKARLSTNWNNTNDIIIMFGSNDECIFDLITFKLLLSNIDENGKFNIPSTLNPNQLMLLVQCANYFAVLSNNDDLLQYYYDHCTKVITNQQLRQWIATKIKILSVFASKHLQQRQNQKFQIITAELKSICNCAHCGRSYCAYNNLQLKQFTYILSLVKESDGLEFIDPFISQLHSFANNLINHNCESSHRTRSNVEAVALMWLLNICTDNTIRSKGYIQCVLLLMTAYVENHSWTAEWIWTETESALNSWTKIVIQLMQTRYPNVMESVVIPTWPYVAAKPPLANRIFATANNQQGHVLALHILMTNISKSQYDKQQYEDFTSKYCH